MPAVQSFPDFTGCIIQDRYQLYELIGSGSFGVVYKAIDLEVADDDENIVAVKVIRLAGRSDFKLAMIEREVIMHTAASNIEGVVTVIDASHDAEWCYLVLEFYNGGDLFEQIVTQQTYLGNDTRLREAFLSLVDAVQACHDAGIAHRDLKPENVLTNEAGSQCYLGDFGFATNQPFVREFGVGTGLYMSPECVGEMTRQAYDPYLSDIWSLGVVLVALITGLNPWMKATTKDANFYQFVVDPHFLSNAHPNISEGALAIIQSLLKLHPERRMDLRTLREAILSLDTFYRLAPGTEYVVREYASEHSSVSPADTATLSACATESGSESGEVFEYSRTFLVTGFEIPRVASDPDIQMARDSTSSGPAMAMVGSDSYSNAPSAPPPPPPRPRPSFYPSYSIGSCSSSRTSSGGSDSEFLSEDAVRATVQLTLWYGPRRVAEARENRKEGTGRGARDVDDAWLDGDAGEVVMPMIRQQQEVRCGPLSYPMY